jgi:hypothetical protein
MTSGSLAGITSVTFYSGTEDTTSSASEDVTSGSSGMFLRVLGLLPIKMSSSDNVNDI